MSINISDNVEDAVANLLRGSATVDEPTILKTVKMLATNLYSEELDDHTITTISRKLLERFDVTMELGGILEAEDFIPWLDQARVGIDWYYWNRYSRYLVDRKFGDRVITSLDLITNKIVDHLENPEKEGSWSRKGLIVGDVQSGKTANYTGVVCKAADAGYKVIIILAGLLNTLRDQTQTRLDEGFIGIDSSRLLETAAQREKIVGVGRINHDRIPVTFTTSVRDFNKSTATQIRTGIGQLKEPIVLVLKKNKSILENLIDWLRSNNLDLGNFPMLLIDDEADNASVNTSKESQEATAINRKIRELLKLFSRNTYLGYTATPFANIFIAPDTDDDMLGDDLFPRDFILTLDAPSNYSGAHRIFSDDADLDTLRELDDFEDIIPLKHKKDEIPHVLPQSLLHAVRVFILIRAARLLRGHENKHHSMMVNISRFTGIQTHVKEMIHQYLEELRHSVFNHFAMPFEQAMGNSNIRALHDSWQEEFDGTEFSWKDVQHTLKEAIAPISVIEVNSSRTSEPLDYHPKVYPNGRSVITVGGLSLSRGLTLEGLTVSYFLRNSIMYDTLMQMGRWFGYRPDYEDLCRIYMTPETISWYSHITDAMEELRGEFRRMERAGMTPSDFGLCVRSHPESLIVTARNKMRTGKKVARQISLEGRLAETSVLFKSNGVVIDNHKVLGYLLNELIELEASGAIARTVLTDFLPNSYYWKEVPESIVAGFIRGFSNHPASQLTESKPLIDYLEKLQKKGIQTCDCIVINPVNSKSDISRKYGILEVKAQSRGNVTPYPGNGVALNKRRVASRGHEKIGLDINDVNDVERPYREVKKSIPDKIYRKVRQRPLLMIHLIDCKKNEESLFEQGIVAYGISFPGEAGSRRPEDLVEYVVNPVWWSENYGQTLEAEEDVMDE